jgi:hypothetical protein
MDEKYLRKSAFAAQRGWSPSYVTKLGHQGRLVFCTDNPKLIDVEATLANLQCTCDPDKERLRQHHSAVRVEKHVTAFVKPDAPSTDESPSAADPKYWTNKTRREGALADMAQLELAKQLGDLVDRKKVEAMAFATGRMLRDAVLGLPTRLAPELATMTDAFEIEVKLRNAYRQVLSDMSKMAADDMAKLLEQS